MLDKDKILELASGWKRRRRTARRSASFRWSIPALPSTTPTRSRKNGSTGSARAGREVKGHKIGLTSKAMQASSNISEPDYGALMDDMFFADGAGVPMARFIVPRVEVELAFILGRAFERPGCTIFDVLNAVEYVTPAVEIIDARIHQTDPETKVTRKVTDTISDNAAGRAS